MELDDIKPIVRTVDILHPGNDEPLGITVDMISMNDPKIKKILRRYLDEKLALEAKGKHVKGEEFIANTNMLIFQSMTGWDWGDNTFKGEVPDFNQRNVFLVLDEKPWFRDQLNLALGDHASFFPK